MNHDLQFGSMPSDQWDIFAALGALTRRGYGLWLEIPRQDLAPMDYWPGCSWRSVRPSERY